MSPRKLVSLPRRIESQDDKAAAQTKPANEPPRFLFVDDLSAKKRDPKAATVKSFIQSEYHRKRKKAALSKLKSSSSAKGLGKGRGAPDRIRECPHCQTTTLGKSECHACGETIGSHFTADRKPISNQLTPYCTDRDKEYEAFLGFVLQHRLKSGTVCSPKSLLGAGKSDPFRTLPCTEGMDVFVENFLSLDQRLFGAPKDGKLMPTRDFTFLLGRDDPATLTAIMAYGASSIPSASRQAILLKGRAIRMVNERLGHIDDALIHAISHLWLVESRFGTPQAAQWHAQAMSKLIASRGGYTALDVRLGLHIGWCVLTTAEPINLTPYPDSSYMTHAFNEFLLFCDFIHELALMPASQSPYALQSSGFARPHRLHLLLSGQEHVSRYYTAHPRLHPLCRLVSLLYVHCIFLEFYDSPLALSQELDKARRWVKEAQALERHVTMETLPCIMAIGEDKNRFNSVERSLRVLRMTMVIKMFGMSRLQGMIAMLYEYVNGREYDSSERDKMWDPRELEREFFQAVSVGVEKRDQNFTPD